MNYFIIYVSYVNARLKYDTGSKIRDSISVTGRIFLSNSKRSDWLCDPSNLLLNGYQLPFTGGKAFGV